MFSFYIWYTHSGKNMGKFCIIKEERVYLFEFSFLEWILENTVL